MFLRYLALLAGCSAGLHGGGDEPDLAPAAGSDLGTGGDGAPAACGTRPECAAANEDRTAQKFNGLDAASLPAFLTAMPKGGDLHNHLSGAVYAETYLGWAQTDGDCVNTSTFAAVYSSQCSASTQPAPASGSFYDQIVGAWSMKDFVAGAQN